MQENSKNIENLLKQFQQEDIQNATKEIIAKNNMVIHINNSVRCYSLCSTLCVGLERHNKGKQNGTSTKEKVVRC
jgi:hypothetical protein